MKPGLVIRLELQERTRNAAPPPDRPEERMKVANQKSKIGNGKSKMIRWSAGPIAAAFHDVSEIKGVSCLEQKCLKSLSHSNKDS